MGQQSSDAFINREIALSPNELIPKAILPKNVEGKESTEYMDGIIVNSRKMTHIPIIAL